MQGSDSCIVAHEHNHIMVDPIRFLICKHLINGHPLATMTAGVERPVNRPRIRQRGDDSSVDAIIIVPHLIMFRRILGALSVRLVFQRAIVLWNLEFGMKIVAKVPLVIRNTRSGATVREEPALPFRVPIHQVFVSQYTRYLLESEMPGCVIAIIELAMTFIPAISLNNCFVV